MPFVVETAMGVGRAALVALVDGYREEVVEGSRGWCWGFTRCSRRSRPRSSR